MIRWIAPRLFVASVLLCAAAHAQPLAVSGGLVDLRTPQGEQMLLESHALDAYVLLSVNFVTQRNQAFCGVASIVVALNAMAIAAPSTPEYEPYHTFTQDNLLDERTEAVVPRQSIERRGMTLDQLGQLLALNPVQAEVHHAADGTLDEFRADARRTLGAGDQVVIVNYLRKTLGQVQGGHISPLAAYDPQADSFLVLDVARYKYPPVWVTADRLFAAMNTQDSDNQDKSRGYVLVQKASAAAQ